MKLASVKNLDPGDTVLVNSSIRNLENITGRIRAIATGLMPSVLADRELVQAVQYFIDSIDSKVKITLQAEELPAVSQAAKVHIYRILQEIIHNSCKHGNVTRLRIHFRHRKNLLVIATVDNGCGFDYDNILKAKKGHGLLNIQNRVQILNGDIHIDTGGGTRYFIEIPLQETDVNMKQQL
jgi:signal transduction histidine kinase